MFCKREDWTKLRVFGIMTLVCLLTLTQIATAKRVSGWGNDLPSVWAEVEVRCLQYHSPQGIPVTTSCHWFQLCNYHDFIVSYDYEFQHEVFDLATNEKMDEDKQLGQGRREVGEQSASNGAVQGLDVSNYSRGRGYRLHAYTRLNARRENQGGQNHSWEVHDEIEFFHPRL